jgi:hypothetical protein
VVPDDLLGVTQLGLQASEPQRHEVTVNLYFVGNLSWPPAEHIAGEPR